MRRFLAALAAVLTLTLALGGRQAGANPITWNYSPDGTSASLPGSATVQGNLGVTGNTTLNNLTVTGSTNLPVASISCSSLPALTGPVTTNPTVTGCATSITANAVTLGDLAQIAGASLIGNAAGSSATPAAVPITACSAGSAAGLTYWSGTGFGCYAPGQYPGTVTNDNAAAGDVGEYISASNAPTAVAMSSGITATLASVSLTPGDWNCWGDESFSGGAGTFNTVIGAIVAGTTVIPSPPGTGAYYDAPATITDASPTFVVGTTRVSIAANTTVYLLGSMTISSGTVDGGGFIACRRAR